ncbi:MAG TPA: TIGR03435 family protein [Bryobacteraceae bacterium]|nr:TIGR03435 family protein [Bryobacteraceae bacterium]
MRAGLMVLAGCLAYGQTGDRRPAFEVASVKPSLSTGGRFSLSGGPGTADPGRMVYSNVPLRIVLLSAYGVRNYQLMGPDWLNTLRYDITARVPQGASREQFQAMLRSLLESRFRLALHRESKEMPIYALLVSRRGSKLQAVAAAPADDRIATPHGEGSDGFPKLSMPSSGIVIETKNGAARVTANASPMAKFADFLSGRTGRPVIDQTGLDGYYSFALYFTPEGAEAGDSAEPDIFAALGQQLGLRLEARRAPVELLVIDHAEKIPTEN